MKKVINSVKITVIALFMAILLLGYFCISPSKLSNAETAKINAWEEKYTDISRENNTLDGWSYYFADAGSIMYEHASANITTVAEGKTDNALKIERKENAPNEVVVYSYPFAVEGGNSYRISLYAKVDVASEGELCFCHNEIYSENYSYRNPYTFTETFPGYTAERNIIGGTSGKWQLVTFDVKTLDSSNFMKIKIMANKGVGTFLIDDIKVQKAITKVAPDFAPKYNVWSVGTFASGVATMTGSLTSDDICLTDSSDGDKSSLKVASGKAFMVNFPFFKNKVPFTLSFKYKNLDGKGKVILSCDCFNSEDIRLYSIPNAKDGGPYVLNDESVSNEWQTFTTTLFSAEEMQYIRFGAQDDANYLIDEIKLVSNEVNFIPNGSFSSNIEVNGVSANGNANVALQPDGKFAYVLGGQTGNGNTLEGHRGFIQIDTSRLDKTKKYKVSFKIAGGGLWGGSQPIAIYSPYPTEVFVLNTQEKFANLTMQEYSSELVTIGDNIQIYGDSYITGNSYIRDIQILDEAGKDYFAGMPNLFDLSSLEETEFGENIFPYGTFIGTTIDVTEWKFEGDAKMQGQIYDDGNSSFFICTEEGKATSPVITLDAVATENTFAKIYYRFSTEGNPNIKLITNDKVVLTPLDEYPNEMDYNANGVKKDYFVAGQYKIPVGTTSICVVIEGDGHYSALKELKVKLHNHTFVADNDADHPAVIQKATCKVEGFVKKYCSDCGEYVYISREAKIEHNWSEWTVTKEPTCTEYGERTRTCLSGGEVETERIDPVPHNYKDGVCTVCGALDPNYVAPPIEKKKSCSSAVSTALPIGFLVVAGLTVLVIFTKKRDKYKK